MSLTVREWRRVREISQETMAEKLKIHVNTYMNWERKPGQIGILKAKEIADIFGVSLDDISFADPEEQTEVSA